MAGGGGGAGGNRFTGVGFGAGGGGGGGYYGGGGGSAGPSPTAVPTGGTQLAGGSGGTSSGNPGTAGSLGFGGNGGNRVFNVLESSVRVAAGGGDGGGLIGSSGLTGAAGTGVSGAGGSSYLGSLLNASTTAGVRSGNGQVELEFTAVPEPSSLALVAMASVFAGCYARRRAGKGSAATADLSC